MIQRQKTLSFSHSLLNWYFIRSAPKAPQLSPSYPRICCSRLERLTCNIIINFKHKYSYCLKSSVRMVWKTCRLAHCELIQHQERIEVSQLEIKYEWSCVNYNDIVVLSFLQKDLISSVRCRPPFYRCSCGHERRFPPTVPR